MNKYFSSFLLGGTLCVCGYGVYKICEEKGENKVKKILCATVAAAVGAIGYSLYNSSKMDSLLDRLDVAADNISKDVVIDISPKVVEEAVYKAVDSRVASRIDSIENEAVLSMRNKIGSAVDNAVNSRKEELKESVKKEMLRKSRFIDIDSIKDELKDKMREDTDELLDHYKDHFDNMSDVYDAVSKVIASRV